jgi:hypothetical protein
LNFAALIEITKSENMNSPSSPKPPGLLLRAYLADGPVEYFIQTDKAKARQIWQGAEPARLFAQQWLIIAGTHSKSVFVCSEIVRMDFFEPGQAWWQFPEDYADVVELSEAEFRKRTHLDQQELMPKREQPTPVGDLLVSFLKLHFLNHSPIFDTVEVPVKLPVENQLFMRFLLSKAAFHMRLTGGGVGVVNLAHLTGFTVYPGVVQVPSDSWEAELMAKEST